MCVYPGPNSCKSSNAEKTILDVTGCIWTARGFAKMLQQLHKGVTTEMLNYKP